MNKIWPQCSAVQCSNVQCSALELSVARVQLCPGDLVRCLDEPGRGQGGCRKGRTAALYQVAACLPKPEFLKAGDAGTHVPAKVSEVCAKFTVKSIVEGG